MLFAEDLDGGTVAPLAGPLIGGLPLAPCLKRSCFLLPAVSPAFLASSLLNLPLLEFCRGSSILCLVAAWHNTIFPSTAHQIRATFQLCTHPSSPSTTCPAGDNGGARLMIPTCQGTPPFLAPSQAPWPGLACPATATPDSPRLLHPTRHLTPSAIRHPSSRDKTSPAGHFPVPHSARAPASATVGRPSCPLLRRLSRFPFSIISRFRQSAPATSALDFAYVTTHHRPTGPLPTASIPPRNPKTFDIFGESRPLLSMRANGPYRHGKQQY